LPGHDANIYFARGLERRKLALTLSMSISRRKPVADSQPAVTDFSAPMTSGQTFQLSGRPARHTVLFFYPKDNTPGCTTENMAFRDLYEQFQAAGTEIYGVSRDSLRSHESFKAKLGLPFELISDPDEALCTQFNVMKMKQMYGTLLVNW
jgi:peroxiredoxin Q/BCP